MKQTLLQLVQSILKSSGSFDVNSINDVEDAQIAAGIIQDTYYSIIARRDGGKWPHLRRTIRLDATSSSTPTHLKFPEYVTSLEDLWYDTRAESGDPVRYTKLHYREPDVFIRELNSRDSTASTTDVITDIGGVTLLIRNDQEPKLWTSFDDLYIVCDAYDSALETNLQNSKTQAIVYKAPSWTEDDSFIPDLPAEAFPYLLQEAKSVYWVDRMGEVNEKAEQLSNIQRKTMTQNAHVAHDEDQLPNYGRRPK